MAATPRWRRFVAPAGLALLAVLFTAPSALAVGSPIVSKASFAEVTETSAKLEATLNPNSKPTTYHFEYIPESTWEQEGFGEGTLVTAAGSLPAGAEAVPVSAAAGSLAPGTAYRFRLFAQNAKGSVNGEERTFATYSPAQIFGPCENDPFRGGQFAPPGHPSALLPDCRAYEQVTPTDKDGGDVIENQELLKASSSGDAVIYGSSAGLPGGVGAQSPPLFRASRGAADWSGTGVLPPGAEAPVAQVNGWLPDLSLFFVDATHPGPPETSALLATGQGPTQQISPYVERVRRTAAYAGASADGSQAFFEQQGEVYVWDRGTGAFTRASRLNTEAETEAALPKGAFAGPYDWIGKQAAQGGAKAGYYTQDERAVGEDGSLFFTAAGSGRLYERLHPAEAQSAVAHPGEPEEECTEAAKACTLKVAASHRSSPDPAGQAPAAFQAASADGATAFFTSSEKLTDDANTGPEVEPPAIGRATLHGEEKAGEVLPELLAGVHAVGVAIDPSGEYVYWADPVDGTIGRARLQGSATPTQKEPSFIEPGETCFETHHQTEPGVIHCAPSSPRYVAVANGHVYWTNTGPLGGEAHLKGGTVQLNEPVKGGGTIGRAELDGSGDLVPGSVEKEWIKGASDPQGIAANAEHIYWANAFNTKEGGNENDIARAEIGGGGIAQQFYPLGQAPQGVALDGTHVYFVQEGVVGFGIGEAFLSRINLDGVPEESSIGFVEGSNPRGVALDGAYLYWARQGAESIGRVPLAEFLPSAGLCSERPGCDPEFIELQGNPAGLATDPAAEHLFWSANGETPPNPGNDLYRFQAEGSGSCEDAGGCLTDLTADPSDPDGAEVQGVLGASADGSRLYFVANAVLASNTVENGAGPEEAEPGDCSGTPEQPQGSCNLYSWEAGGGPAGSVAFIARLGAANSGNPAYGDAFDWTMHRIFAGEQVERTSRLTPSGDTLLFRSQRRLTAYDNEGVPEYYLYRLGRPLTCLTCEPTGAPPGFAPQLGSVKFIAAAAATNLGVLSRNLSADGRRFFFESSEALVAGDTDGGAGCPQVGGGVLARTCQDVYEWEAPGAGSCEEGVPPYTPANQGCLYLLSDGSEAEPSYFLDASASGDDAFVLTRSRLVGQDADSLLDVYDARSSGGLASQNSQPSPICDSPEACRPETTPAPLTPAPLTPGFQGEGNVKEKPRACPKGKVRRHGRCVKKHRPRKHRQRSTRR